MHVRAAQAVSVGAPWAMAGSTVVDDAHRPPAWYEKALVIAGFLVIIGTFRSYLLSGGGDRQGGSALFQLVAGSIYLSAILLLSIRGTPKWAFKVLLRAWPLVLLTLLTIVSTMWSQAPDTTLRRSIALSLSACFALYIVIRFDFRSALNLLAIAFAVFLTIGIFSAAVPGLGVTPSGVYAGAWRGLTGNKNVFGRTVALGVALLPLAAVLGLISWRRLVLLLTPIAIAALLLSRSATSTVSAFAAIGVGVILYVGLGGRIGRLRVRPDLGIPLLLIAFVSGFLIVSFGWTTILEALGRDPTLTGRTKLWEWATDINEGRQWLGSGYRAFWIDANTLYFSEVFWWGQDIDGNRSDTNRGPGHAHSGYMDTYLDLGFLGVTALGVLIVSAIAGIRRTLAQRNNALGLMSSVILAFLLIYAVTEQSILQQSEDLWFLFSMLYLYMAKDNVLHDRRIAESLRAPLAARADLGAEGAFAMQQATR